MERLTVAGFVDEIHERFGDRPALRFEGRTWTYDELVSEIRRCARAFVGAGAVKGNRVAILSGNRPESIVVFLAASTVGAVVIPVSTFAVESERDHVLRHSDATWLVVEDELLKHRFAADVARSYPGLRRGERTPALPFMRRVVELNVRGESPSFEPFMDFLGAADAVSDTELAAVQQEVAPADDALVIYTSGTTNRPKGVLHNQRTLVLQGRNIGDQLRLTPDDRVLNSKPFFWSAGIALGMLAPLAMGSCLVMQEWFDAQAALEQIESERVTTVFVAPHQEAAIADLPDARNRDLSSLRKLTRPSSPLRPLAGIDEHEWTACAYGMSETLTYATSTPADTMWEERGGVHGKPMPGLELRIVDDDGAELPLGATGEICVRGVTLMEGYYKVPREEVFDRDGFFHTGDEGTLFPDGTLRYSGRRSAMIKTGGANVSPIELEEELAGWDRIGLAMAVGVPHPTLGEAVVLCVTKRTDEELAEDEIRDYLKGRVASYKVPRRVLFVEESELTFTSSEAKVRLESLQQLAAMRLVEGNQDAAWSSFLSEQAKAAGA
jgi:fatty-acyl-CoA synthase